jgi:hypothetical protein
VEPNAGGPTSDHVGAEAHTGSEVRRQEAGFSIFLDQVADEQGRPHWETRLYHAESGVETTLAGASPEHWIAWILERLGSPDIGSTDPRLEPRRAVVELASVEIDDVTVADDVDGRGGSLHTIKARVTVQLAGVAPLEREIGSQILRGIAHPRPRSPRRR